MNVLSLFDGCGMAYQALKNNGVQVDNYWAAEIDKYAMQIAKKNHPDIKHIGSVLNWVFWDAQHGINSVDLLIGGSPCQGFSFAGKQLNFEDQRSKLFFKYVECLKAFKPKYFVLENVVMKQEYQDVISDLLGVKPIKINSALVTAQNRNRIYWLNIPDIEQPEDRGILLKDILQETGIPAIKSHGTFTIKEDKSQCLDANYHKGVDNHGQRTVICKQIGLANVNGHDCLKRVYSVDYKSPTIPTCQGEHQEPKIGDPETLTWRKLTPVECERLQGLVDNYTQGVSNSQRYKMLGNGFTVPVISHILGGLK